MKRKVLFIGDKDFLKKYTDESIYKKYDITVLKAGTSDDEVLEKCPEAEVLIVGAMLPVSEKLITGLKNLKLIHSNGVGYQAIDIKAADRAKYPCLQLQRHKCRGSGRAHFNDNACLAA